MTSGSIVVSWSDKYSSIQNKMILITSLSIFSQQRADLTRAGAEKYITEDKKEWKYIYIINLQRTVT